MNVSMACVRSIHWLHQFVKQLMELPEVTTTLFVPFLALYCAFSGNNIRNNITTSTSGTCTNGSILVLLYSSVASIVIVNVVWPLTCNWQTVLIEWSFVVFSLKKIVGHMYILGPLIPRFQTSGDVSSGSQNQSGQPYSEFGKGVCDILSPRFISGVTPFPVYMASIGTSHLSHVFQQTKMLDLNHRPPAQPRRPNHPSWYLSHVA